MLEPVFISSQTTRLYSGDVVAKTDRSFQREAAKAHSGSSSR